VAKLDFSKCLVNPLDNKSVDKLNPFPEFVALRGTVNFTKWLKYIVLVYDLYHSPIKGLYPDIGERKYQAAKLAGFTLKEDGRFSENDEKRLYGMDNDFNKLIVRYIILQNSPDIIAYTAYSELLALETQRSLNALDYKPSETKTIRESIDNLIGKLNDLHERIFSETPTKELKSALYKTIESDKISIRPEDIADSLQKKSFFPVVDPYNTQ